MKKKFSFILLALVLCVGAFALVGCGPKSIDTDQLDPNYTLYEYKIEYEGKAIGKTMIEKSSGEGVGVDKNTYQEEGKIAFEYYSTKDALRDMKINGIVAEKGTNDEFDIWEVKLDKEDLEKPISIEAYVQAAPKPVQRVYTWSVVSSFDKEIK